MNGFIAGFSLGFSLIVAIGSQNAYVLRQGLRHEHVFIICFICFLSDALLIALGVSGLSVLISKAPWIEPVARYGGAIFLLIYGAISLFRAITRKESLTPSPDAATPLLSAILTCLAFTWLNPHVYLDTVILLGSVSTQYAGQQVDFAAGAALASLLFFFTLGYGAGLLAPLFKKPLAWKILDLLIAGIMWSIAFSLIRSVA